jgi:aldose 1-epimerase
MIKSIFLLSIFTAFWVNFKPQKSPKTFGNNSSSAKFQNPKIKVKEFGRLSDGRSAMIYTLKNNSGMEVAITNLGGHILSIKVPDKNGNFADVTLGCDSLSQYIKGTFFGPITGRFANRIGGAKFSLDGKEYNLAKNNGENSIHGGKVGFDKKLWKVAYFNGEQPSIVLSYISPDMEEGYPGNLTVVVTYTLQKNNALSIGYKAHTDKPTVINLTNHTYFNLAGVDENNNILDHELTIFANKITEFDRLSIPTGKFLEVKNTPLDFTKAIKIGARIDDTTNVQINYAHGYDNCFVFTNTTKKLKPGAVVYEPKSGRLMEMFTTEPGVQLYTANHMSGKLAGKKGVKYGRRSGFCLETQHFPDSPNKPKFPSTILRPGQTFSSTTIYKFSVK